MDERVHIGLEKLPHFTIRNVDVRESEMVLTGFFDHLDGVTEGRAWLYPPHDESIEGDLSFSRRKHIGGTDIDSA